MSSLGNEAFVGTLHYKALQPPIGGFVNNPLTGTLDCGNQDLTNAKDITCSQLNYTTLNPPFPTGTVSNPMIATLDGGNFNITNINSLTASSGSFTNSALGIGNATSLTTPTVNVSGALTSTGTAGFVSQITSGLSTFNGRVNMNNQLYIEDLHMNKVELGTVAAPVDLDTVPTITLGSKSSVVVFGYSGTNQNVVTFKIDTGITNAIEKVGFIVSSNHLDPSVSTRVIQDYAITDQPSTNPARDEAWVTINFSGGIDVARKQRIQVLVIRH